MSYSNALASFIAFTIMASAATADGICDVVLKEQAFDRSASSIQWSIALAQHDALCARDYTDEGEAQTAVRNAGFSFKNADGSGGGSYGKRNANNRWEISETSLCTASANDLRQAYSGVFEATIASGAVNAWLECVKESERNAIFLTYKVEKDGKSFTGDLVTTANSGNLARTIKGISVIPPNNDVSCDIGGVIHTPQTVLENPVQISEAGTAVGCWRTGDAPVTIAFQTNMGSLPRVSLPTAAAIEQARLDTLVAEVDALRSLIRQNDGIAVIRSESYVGSRAESIYDISLEERALLVVSGSARGDYNGPLSNAGTYLHIFVDNQECSSDLSFEGSSATISFFSSGSCVKILEAGEHKLSVTRQDAAITGGASTRFDWHLLKLRK